jgi:hypothetical protein
MFIGMGLVLSQGRGSGRDIDCLSDYITQGDGPNTNYPVEKVPERFRPLDNRQGLDLGSFRGVLLLLDLQSPPLGPKVFHHIGPLEIGGGVVSASGIIVVNQVSGNL